MNVSIVGTGYVGLVSGTCFAEIGHNVTCIDIDAGKIEKLKQSQSPIYEPGLEEMIARNLEAGRLHFSTDYSSCAESEAVFLAVGTPPKDDGGADLTFLYQAIDSVIEVVNKDVILVIKSTVPIGTANEVKRYLDEKAVENIEVVNNPEFLKEGAAIQDFMRPDRIVLGCSDSEAGSKIARIYEPFVRQGHPIFQMSNLSAEMTKYAANSFLATKISFINEVAKLCDATGANIDEVRKGIMSDIRIGTHFLYPGPGYGGSCFPKDVQAMIKTANLYDSPMRIIQAAEDVNYQQRKYIFNKIMRHFGSDIKDKTFTFWGVAFKANTDDIRETPAIEIGKMILDAGGKVVFYDPEAASNYQEYMQRDGYVTTAVKDKYSALSGSNALVVLTEWKEFQNPDFSKVQTNLADNVVFDMRNLYHRIEVEESGLDYYGIGRPQ